MPRRLLRVKQASIFVAVPSEPDRTWQEIAASNRERIRALEYELGRTRDAVHKLGADTAALAYLTREMAELAAAVKEQGEQIGRIARRALEKPTLSVFAVFGQYIGLAVAVVALIVASSR